MMDLVTLMALVTMAVGPVAGWPGQPRGDEPVATLDRLLQTELARGTTGTARIIVRAKPDRLDQAAAAVEACGGEVVSRLEFIQAVTARLDMRRLRDVMRHPAVASISSDGPVETKAGEQPSSAR